MKLIYNFLIIVVFMLLASCAKDNLISEAAPIDTDLQFKPDLVDGRLVFQAQSDFDEYYKFIRDLDYLERREQLMPFYKNGFTGLFPVLVLDEDDDMILEYKAKRIERDSNKTVAKGGDGEMDQSDSLIGDDDVAALLNVDREVVIGGKAYIFFENGIIRTSSSNANKLKSALVEYSQNGLKGNDN